MNLKRLIVAITILTVVSGLIIVFNINKDLDEKTRDQVIEEIVVNGNLDIINDYLDYGDSFNIVIDDLDKTIIDYLLEDQRYEQSIALVKSGFNLEKTKYNNDIDTLNLIVTGISNIENKEQASELFTLLTNQLSNNSLESPDSDGSSLAINIVHANEGELLEILLNRDIDLSKKYNDLTCFEVAIMYSEKDILQQLINEDFDRDVLGQYLIIAVQHENNDAVDVLVNSNCNIDYQDDEGDSALHKAIDNLNFDITKLLIDKGASKTIKNNDLLSPKEYAYSQKDALEDKYEFDFDAYIALFN